MNARQKIYIIANLAGYDRNSIDVDRYRGDGMRGARKGWRTARLKSRGYSIATGSGPDDDAATEALLQAFAVKAREAVGGYRRAAESSREQAADARKQADAADARAVECDAKAAALDAMLTEVQS